jgi:hypothetical protein
MADDDGTPRPDPLQEQNPEPASDASGSPRPRFRWTDLGTARAYAAQHFQREIPAARRLLFDVHALATSAAEVRGMIRPIRHTSTLTPDEAQTGVGREAHALYRSPSRCVSAWDHGLAHR